MFYLLLNPDPFIKCHVISVVTSFLTRGCQITHIYGILGESNSEFLTILVSNHYINYLGSIMTLLVPQWKFRKITHLVLEMTFNHHYKYY